MKTNQGTARRMPARLFAVVTGIALATGLSAAQTVITHTDASTNLSGRWAWAKEEAGKKNLDAGYWIGYSILRQMGERTFIGSFYSDEARNRPTLGEIVTGMRAEELPASSGGGFGSTHGTMNFDNDGMPERMVTREVGLLFHIGRVRHENRTGRSGDEGQDDRVGRGQVAELEVSNLSLHVDFGGDPLIWLGEAGTDESVDFLDKAFRETPSREVKKEFMMAIGLHRESKKALDILKNILLGSGDPELREGAAFWLGQTKTDEARKILGDVAWNDASEDVREKAIFSMSQIDGEATVDAIIALARGHKDNETRQKAAFWLGQMASKKAVGALKDLAYKDEDTQVQRSAMFALTQIEDGGGVDELMKIARTHPNPKIRRDAIFWLGQSEDPRALDLLVEIVKGK